MRQQKEVVETVVIVTAIPLYGWHVRPEIQKWLGGWDIVVLAAMCSIVWLHKQRG